MEKSKFAARGPIFPSLGSVFGNSSHGDSIIAVPFGERISVRSSKTGSEVSALYPSDINIRRKFSSNDGDDGIEKKKKKGRKASHGHDQDQHDQDQDDAFGRISRPVVVAIAGGSIGGSGAMGVSSSSFSNVISAWSDGIVRCHDPSDGAILKESSRLAGRIFALARYRGAIYAIVTNKYTSGSSREKRWKPYALVRTTEARLFNIVSSSQEDDIVDDTNSNDNNNNNNNNNKFYSMNGFNIAVADLVTTLGKTGPIVTHDGCIAVASGRKVKIIVDDGPSGANNNGSWSAVADLLGDGDNGKKGKKGKGKGRGKSGSNNSKSDDSVDEDGEIDGPSCRIVHTYEHRNEVTSLAFSPWQPGMMSNSNIGKSDTIHDNDGNGNGNHAMDIDMAVAAGASASPRTLSVGDAQGQIHLLDIDSLGADSTAYSLLHWHSHAVTASSFSPDGVYLITGGEEGVLVLWQLSTGHRQFLPRLGGPIRHIAVSDDGSRYALTVADNAVRIVLARTMAIDVTVRGLARNPRSGIHIPWSPNEPPAWVRHGSYRGIRSSASSAGAIAGDIVGSSKYGYGAGRNSNGGIGSGGNGNGGGGNSISNSFKPGDSFVSAVDPRTKGLAMAQAPGLLQIFDVLRDEHVDDVSVVPRMYVSRQETEIPVETWVTHASFDATGNKLVTAEARERSESVSVKFWHRRNEGTAGFVLDTRVDDTEGCATLAYHPTRDIVCVCARNGGVFKMYTYVEPPAGQSDGHRHRRQKRRGGAKNAKRRPLLDGPSTGGHWECKAVAQFRDDLAIGSACFSPDGSILAIAYGPILTFWDPNSLSGITTANFGSDISKVRFLGGEGSDASVVLVLTEKALVAWSCIAGEQLWTLDIDAIDFAVTAKGSMFAVLVRSPTDAVAVFPANDPHKVIAVAKIEPLPSATNPSNPNLNSNISINNNQQNDSAKNSKNSSNSNNNNNFGDAAAMSSLGDPPVAITAVGNASIAVHRRSGAISLASNIAMDGLASESSSLDKIRGSDADAKHDADNDDIDEIDVGVSLNSLFIAQAAPGAGSAASEAAFAQSAAASVSSLDAMFVGPTHALAPMSVICEAALDKWIPPRR